MATIDLYENSTRPPTEVLADLELSEDAVRLMAEAANTRGFLNQLAAAELYPDSFRALARAMPKNFAILWARECLRQTGTAERAESASRCLKAADDWLAAPDEAGRRRAAEAADEAKYSHPEAWLAAAIGWSSGSLAPPDLEVVRPPDHLTAVAVGACLSLLVSTEPDSMDTLSRSMMERGLQMVAQPDAGRRA